MDARQHVCIWFDDGAGGAELLCACGDRAVAVLDELTGDVVLVPLTAEPVRAMAATA